ncbi:MAG: DUF1648 domain-containing protein [Acidobacteriia bacterium]|nr:DUF1648 domain-containing protein [Terriglobia bacterium]
MKLYRMLTGLLWLSIPLVAISYAQVWDQLPARMATHFDMANHPNGWMSREVALGFGLGLLVLMAGVATWVASRVKKTDAGSWAMLGIFYLVIGLLVWTQMAMLDFNLYGTPFNVAPVVGVMLGGVLVLSIVFLGAKRGTPLPDGEVLAEEVHHQRAWLLVMLPPALPMIGVVLFAPAAGLRIALGMGCLIMLFAVGLTWSGFRYRFTRHGLEISTMGLRLRSVPLEQIKEYAASDWSFMGGYGIRGVGEDRAYVWGNKGVRIKTEHGDVFLGHSEPERIVRDLDMMKQFAH